MDRAARQVGRATPDAFAVSGTLNRRDEIPHPVPLARRGTDAFVEASGVTGQADHGLTRDLPDWPVQARACILCRPCGSLRLLKQFTCDLGAGDQYVASGSGPVAARAWSCEPPKRGRPANCLGGDLTANAATRLLASASGRTKIVMDRPLLRLVRHPARDP